MLAFVLALAGLGPVPPLGARAEFLSASLAAQEALEAGRFEEAANLVRARLPSLALGYRWELGGGAGQKAAAFGVARERAFQAWRDVLPGFRAAASDHPRVLFRLRLAASSRFALRWSDDPSEPRLTAELSVAHPNDVRNGVAYALGAWFGLEDSLFPDQAMWPSPKAGGPVQPVTRREAALARELVAHARELESLAAGDRRVVAARPRAVLRVAGKAPERVVQGEEAVVPLILSNAGNAPLLFRTTSTCGCMASVPSGSLAPGQTLRLDAILDTAEYQGPVRKSLWVLTNSVELPREEIPVETFVQPRYEFRGPPMPVDAESPDRAFQMLLETPASAPMEVLSAELEGIGGTATVGRTQREGDRLRTPIEVRFAPISEDGRIAASVRLTTDDARFATVRLPFAVQRGLAALPGSVVLQRDGHSLRPAEVRIVSPGRPFRIVGFDSASPELTARPESEGQAAEHRVVLRWSGDAPQVGSTVTVRIRTDWGNRTVTVVVQVPPSAQDRPEPGQAGFPVEKP